MTATSTETARALAVAHPAATLPCPICAVSVKAANLDVHLGRVHPGAVDARPPWRGADRRIVRTALLALAAALVASTAMLVACDVKPGGPVAWTLVAVVVATSLAVVGAYLGAPRATLSLTDDTLVLRHSLGLGRRVATLPCALVTGALVGGRPDLATSAYATDPNPRPVRRGGYLQVGAITIGCRASTSLRAHWDPRGWRAGDARWTCDVVVSQEVMVAIEYALAARGALSPNTAPKAPP